MVGFYFGTLTQLLTSPGEFFSQMPKNAGLRRPLGFLLASSLFFTGASLTYIAKSHAVMAAVFLANALSLPFLAAAVSYLLITVTMGRRWSYSQIFAGYAFSSALTLLVSWIPLFFWITEPWKGTLVTISLVKGCGMTWSRGILVVVATVLVLFLLFSSLGPLFAHFRPAGS